MIQLGFSRVITRSLSKPSVPAVCNGFNVHFNVHGLLSQVVSSSISWSTRASHGCWMASFESHIAGVTVEHFVSYSDFSPGFRSSQISLTVCTLKTAQMITELEGLDDHGRSLSQRGVTERTVFLATH